MHPPVAYNITHRIPDYLLGISLLIEHLLLIKEVWKEILRRGSGNDTH